MSSSAFLAPSRFVDSDSPLIIDFAGANSAGAIDTLDCVLRLYRAVRDGIIYDPYIDYSDLANYKASQVLEAGRGFCVGKAALLAACARAVGIPARVGYADVRNHLTSPRLYDHIKTDVFRWHSYTDLQLNGKWVKATPAFNGSLCKTLGLAPLDFDGQHDSLFHAYDQSGRRHMEYLTDRGTFVDVPADVIIADFRSHYPSLMAADRISGDFHNDAISSDVLDELL